MIRWVKGGIFLAVGVVVFGLGFISAVNFSFDWENSMPSSIILAVVFIPAGGTLFAHGLMTLETPPKTSPDADHGKHPSPGAPS